MMGKEDINRFNGIGFHTWQVKVKGLLMKKGLWSVVKNQGEEEVITTRGKTSQFAQKDEKALGIIITCLGDDY